MGKTGKGGGEMTELWCLMWDRALTPAERETLTAMLPPRRRQRLPVLPRRQAEPLCAYGLLRLALWERHGVRELPAIALSNHGKPYFPAFPQLHFSISHTEGAALVGLSDAPVGVDVEKVRPVGPRLKALLGKVETDGEALRRWTCREAHAKRTGQGLAEAMQAQLHMEAGETCRCVEAAQGYAAAFSVTGPPPQTLHRRTLADILKDGR